MKWYEQRYVNHRDWILEYIELLGLNEKEVILVLLIDFLNEYHTEITLDLLHRKTGYSMDELDRLISGLCVKKYLEILVSNKSVRFSLNGLFEANVAQEQRMMDSSLFDVFESEFSRPLSQFEMQKISDWNRIFDRKFILYALREASIYRKVNLPYIEKILLDWQSKGMTVEKIEEGYRHEG